MDDSDDYPDDFIFDEQTLAILDQEEQKYLTQSSSLVPVTKKLKTSTGWKPGIGARTISHDNLDDLPEISLHGDGTYGVKPTGAKRSTVGSPLAPAHLHEANSAVYQPAEVPPLRFPSVHLSQNQRQLSSHQHTKPISAIASSAKRTTSSPSGIMSLAPAAHPLEGQMLEYQKKLDELREENTRIQTALKEALDARIAKEGEVSILRKSIEKTSQNHSAQITKLKMAKDEADAKRVQLQKELKEEMESLKTQYIFKQHELEASLRKPPMSSRSKKILREPPSTPLVIPVQMRNWNSNDYEQGPSKSFSQETPLKPQRLPSLKESPSRSRLSPSKMKKPGMLPGFQNSFAASTPLRPTKSRANKGKAKAEDDDSFFHDLRSPSRSQRNAQRFSSPPPLRQQNDFDRMLDTDTVVQPPAGHTVPTSLRVLDDDGDAVMAEDSEGEVTLEELNFLGPTNWKAELCQIILTHARPKLGEITFQVLLGVSLAVVETDRLAEDYAIACSKVLQTVANTSTDSNYNLSLDAICQSLFMIATILSTADQLLPLASLLNLLSVLVYSLPGFTVSFFSHQEKPEDRSSFINFLCTLIVKKLAPSATHIHKDDLADEVLLLLQSLCHNTPDDLVPSLATIPSHQEAMTTILDPKQPSWLLAKACKLLALLSTHHVLFRSLLSNPGSGRLDERTEDEEQKSIYVERLCLHLIDFDRQDPDSRDLKKSILQFFAQLSISHLDAHTILVESYSLMPSLVLYLTELTTPLWEDAKHLMSSQEATASIIRTTNQTLFLIHHLVFSTDPALNLRYQLQCATNRVFSNIIHMFIVTLGRLSYADPPEWADSQGRYELETLSEMSRDILELVVDGPEGDSIWAAFQVEPEPGSAVDDEELEARRIMDGDG